MSCHINYDMVLANLGYRKLNPFAILKLVYSDSVIICDWLHSQWHDDPAARVELGKDVTEAHMQNRKLISEWCYEKGLANNVIEKKVENGKTYFVIHDFEALRGLFGELLAEVQRIKSEGDYAAGKALVEQYAVKVDPELHKEVKERYNALGLKPYGGFINPVITPVEKDGQVVDYTVEYPDDFVAEHLDLGKNYSFLPAKH